MDKINVNNYEVSGASLATDKKLAFLSDVHGNVNKLEKIIELLKDMKTTSLLIGGDLVDDLKDTKRNEQIKELLQELAKTTDIFVAIGNHDMIYFGKDSKGRRKEIQGGSDELKFWSSLESVSRIYVSELPIYTSVASRFALSDDIDISIINMPMTYYWNGEQKAHYDVLKKVLDNFSMATKKFNILICHSPRGIIQGNSIDEYLKDIKAFNLILSGHMHCGLVPGLFRRDNIRQGIVGPYSRFWPDNAYGHVKDGKSDLLISGGVEKLANSLVGDGVVGSMINSIYPPEVYVFDMTPEEESSFKKYKKM